MRLKALAAVLIGVAVAAAAAAGPRASAGGSSCLVTNGLTGATSTIGRGDGLGLINGGGLKIRGACEARGGVPSVWWVFLFGDGPGASLRMVPTDGGPPIQYVDQSGHLKITNLTLVKTMVINWGSFTMRNSVLADGLGLGVLNLGTMVMGGNSLITGNRGLHDEVGTAGGVSNHGLLEMSDTSRISGNAGSYGGGVANYGTLAMWDSTRISGNSASIAGGGIYNAAGATLMLHDSSAVRDNSPDNIYFAH